MPVPVDVIRVSFWMRFVMKMVDAVNSNCKIRVLGSVVQEKFKIPMDKIEFSDGVPVQSKGFMWGQPPPAVRRAQLDDLRSRRYGYSSAFFMLVANCRSKATKAVEATESVRSRR